MKNFPAKLLGPIVAGVTLAANAADELRIGMIGLDTSHVTAFTALLNDPKSPNHVSGAKVVAAFKGGSPDIESSWSRVEGYTKELREKYGVAIHDPAKVQLSLLAEHGAVVAVERELRIPGAHQTVESLRLFAKRRIRSRRPENINHCGSK